MDLPLRDVSGVFAYLPFGGWDSSPSPEAMLSIARYWFERDDAYPAVIASDFIEFYTPVPVTTRRDAEILAVEHTMVSSAMPVRVYRGFDNSWRRSTVSTTGTCGGSSSRRRSSLKCPKPA